MSGPRRNIAASVGDRLRALSRERKEDHQHLLIRYAGERLLYRLGCSPYRDRFVLKGARLFEQWTGDAHRPTRDVDFLGCGSPRVEDLIEVFGHICSQLDESQDGLLFPADRITGTVAREGRDYQGASLKLVALLGKAEIPVQLDFGFGDAVTPGAELSHLPTLLDHPAPEVRTYPRETVVAEKFQAMVSLGISNSRMKDFYDVWLLARDFDFDGEILSAALSATFERRGTALPDEPPIALTAEFSTDRAKHTQWNAFVRRSGLSGEGTSLEQVVAAVRPFLLPPSLAAARKQRFRRCWVSARQEWQASDR